MSARLTGLDPLLKLPIRDTPPDLEVEGAAGWTETTEIDAQSVAASYGALVQHRLYPAWSADVAAVDRLVSRWRDQLQARPSGPDSQAAVLWPSRDVDIARVLFAHGMHPAAALAVRAAGPPTGHGSALVRRAGPADVDAVVELAAQELAYESGLSSLTLRPGFAAARTPGLADELAAADPWTWVAEVGGAVVGTVCLQKPEQSLRVGELCSLSPVAYIAMLSVQADRRGQGIGGALVHTALRQLADAKVAACLLHYGLGNPLSVPFWSRQGFHPLWTAFEAVPAHTLR